MTPFNHELARQGHPCQTRSGKEVKQLTWHQEPYLWTGVVDGKLETWNVMGLYFVGRESGYDLFMSDQPTFAVQKYDRAEIAAKMMAAILSNPAHNSLQIFGVNAEGDSGFIAANMAAEEAVRYTDALINELNKEKQ
jgi:hypothetical protein